MRQFLLWMGGGEPEVLEQAPSTAGTTTALGGTVLTTSLMATAAFTMATHDWLHVPWGLAVVVGCAWGLAIMNLDRWLLMATRRQRTTLFTIALAVPRVMLAVVIAFVIAEPLVLRVFDSEVTLQAQQDRQAQKTAREKSLQAQFTDIPQMERDQRLLRQTVAAGPRAVFAGNADYRAAKAAYDQTQQQLADAQRSVGCEAQGTCGTRKAGCGPQCLANRNIAAQRQRAADRAERELNTVIDQLRQSSAAASRRNRALATPEVQRVNRKLAQRRAARDKALAEIDRDFRTPIGAINRIEALNHLAAQSAAVASSTWLFRLFLIAVDLTPILFKTLILVGEKSQAERVKEAQEQGERKRNRVTEKAKANAHRISARLIEKEAEIETGLLEPELRTVKEKSVEVIGEVWREQMRAWAAAVRAAGIGGQGQPGAGAGPNVGGPAPFTAPPATPRPAAASAGPTAPAPGGSGAGMAHAVARPGVPAGASGLASRARARLAGVLGSLRRPAARTAGP